jgi:hypothetical protein
MPSITSKTDTLQKKRTEFRTKVNLSKEECIKMIPPFLKVSNLIALEHKHICNGQGERNN